MQRLVDVLENVARPGQRLRVVHVGGAAMTLPRYLAATRPTSAQIVLEPDTELTAFVRRHLPLPTRSGIKVRGTDGRHGVAELRDGYADLVIIDAFIGARVPAELTTAEFLADARRALSDHGVLIINLTDRGPLSYARRVGRRTPGLSASSVVRRTIDAEGPALRQCDHRRRRNTAAARRHRGACGKATLSVPRAAWCAIEPATC